MAINAIVCPYCGQDVGGYYLDIIDSSMSGDHECPHCGKTFWWEVNYEISTYQMKLVKED